MSTVLAGERRMTAFLDGPDRADIANPIHSTAVAAEYGFRAALVGGVTVYGWCAPPILEVLGEGWLADGWADVAFRQPVYPGDALVIRVEGEGGGEEAAVTLTNAQGVTCIAGRVGRGKAPFLGELAAPARRTAEPRPAALPWLTLANAPVGEDLRPMAVPLGRDDAEAYATEKQDDAHPRWYGPGARIHPGWLAARMTPLIHHSYDYAPAIHTRSQIQHLAPALAGQTVTVAGRFVEAFERKGHHYGVVDGVIIAAEGRELARIRHTTIFRVAKKA